MPPEASRLKLSCTECRLGLASGAAGCPFREVRRKPGSVLHRQGEMVRRIGYVRSGLVLLSSVSRSGEELWCKVRGREYLVGFESALGAPTQSSAVALSDLRLCALDLSQFRDWLGSLGSPLGAMLELSLRELSRAALDLQHSSGGAPLRLARLLLERYDAGSGPKPLEVPKVVLARMLGMRPETLSRAIAELSASGVLAKGRRMMVADFALLRRVVEG